MTPPCLPSLLLAALLALAPMALSQERGETPSLEEQLRALTADFEGEVGVYVRHLETGEEVAIAADGVAPTASLIKVPIMCALFERIEKGELAYRAKRTYTKDRLYSKEDPLGAFEDRTPISLAKLVTLMITFSDNTASLWCQELAGTGTAINAWLSRHGFEKTRMNSRTPGREEAKMRFGWGQTTPREMAELFVKIRKGEAVSPAASEEMYRALTRVHWDGEALAMIPPTVQVASKQGAVNASRSEVLLVNAPHGDYVLAVITQKQKDESWEHENAGWTLIRAISRTCYRHFEPTDPWQPTPEGEAFR